MLPVRSHDHHAAVWAHHAEYERQLHSLLDALPKDFADDFGQFIHFLVLPGKARRFLASDPSRSSASLARPLYAARSCTFVSAYLVPGFLSPAAFCAASSCSTVFCRRVTTPLSATISAATTSSLCPASSAFLVTSRCKKLTLL